MESKYSIKDLEHLSGIKAHTLRIWEQRYNLIEPKRTPTNIRYYSDSDLKRILNVSVLVHSGMRISKVCELSESQIRNLILEKGKYEGELSGLLNGLKLSMMNFDQTLFERIINTSINQLGYKTTFTQVIGRFVKDVGLLWQTGAISVANEHFVSNLIRQKLCTAIDQLPILDNDDSYSILFLPNNELHELGLLYVQYALRSKGIKTIYMGQSIPIEDLAQVLEKKSVNRLLSIFTSYPHQDDIESYLVELNSILQPSMQVHICGFQVQNVNTTIPNMHIFSSLEDMLKHNI